MELSRTAYLTLDTTGLTGKVPGWTPRIVALGLALVENNQVLHSTGGLIHQDADHVSDPRARGAWQFNGIEPRDVVHTTTTESQIAVPLKETLTGCTLRGYNVEFLWSFLSQEPFGLTEWGDCVMKEAAEKDFVTGKLSRTPRYPTLNEALYWAAAEGHDVTPPDNTKTRAHANAVRVAKLAIALGKNQ